MVDKTEVEAAYDGEEHMKCKGLEGLGWQDFRIFKSAAPSF